MIPRTFLIFMVVLMAFAGACSVEAESGSSQGKVIAYYFYGGVRCSSCVLLEKYTGEAMEKWFPEEMVAGRVEYRPVDLEKSGNEHFVKDFQLYSKAVVLVHTEDGRIVRWKNLDKVWTLLADREAFNQYIGDEVTSYLKSR